MRRVTSAIAASVQNSDFFIEGIATDPVVSDAVVSANTVTLTISGQEAGNHYYLTASNLSAGDTTPIDTSQNSAIFAVS